MFGIFESASYASFKLIAEALKVIDSAIANNSIIFFIRVSILSLKRNTFLIGSGYHDIRTGIGVYRMVGKINNIPDIC